MKIQLNLAFLVFAFCVLFNSPIFACLELPPHPPEMEIIPCTGPNYEMKLILKNYDTYGANPGEYCACALNLPLTYGTVISAAIVHAGTLTPVDGWSFAADPDTQFPTPGFWQGFSSDVTMAIGADIPVDIVFCIIPYCEPTFVGNILVQNECDCTGEAKELLDIFASNTASIGTAGADANGFPFHHISEVQPGSVTVGDLIHVDDYNDGINNNYIALNGTSIVETGGELMVSNPGGTCNIIVQNPTRKSQLGSCDQEIAWCYNAEIKPNSPTQQMQIDAVDIQGNIIESAIYDFANNSVYSVFTNPYTGLVETKFLHNINLSGGSLSAVRQRRHDITDLPLAINIKIECTRTSTSRSWTITIGKSTPVNGTGIEPLSHINIQTNDGFSLRRMEFRADEGVSTKISDTWSLSNHYFKTGGGETGKLYGMGFLSATSIQLFIDGTPIPHSVIDNSQIDFGTIPTPQGNATLTLLMDNTEVDFELNFSEVDELNIDNSNTHIRGTLAQVMNHQFTITGLQGVSYSLAYGSLPTGLSLSASGILSGIPTQLGSFPIHLKATDIHGNEDVKFFLLDIGQGRLELSIKAFLQGPFNISSLSMNSSINNLLPLTDPYGFNQRVGTYLLNNNGGNTIVDWVQVELRPASNASTVAESRAALIQADGDIVDVDGVSPLNFCGLSPTENYHVVVKHRNHLGVMTNFPVQTY